jgi:hypothetical protein
MRHAVQGGGREERAMGLHCARHQEVVLWRAMASRDVAWLGSEIGFCQKRRYRVHASLEQQACRARVEVGTNRGVKIGSTFCPVQCITPRRTIAESREVRAEGLT